MARIRSIKHEYFTNEVLAQASAEARLLGIALTTLADREGRLEDRPLRIRAQAFPYHQVNVDDLLNELQDAQFIHRYSTEDSHYIQIINFHRHQTPHFKERPSLIPAPVDISVDFSRKACESPPCIMGNGSIGNGKLDPGNGKKPQPKPRRPPAPEIDPPFHSEAFIESLQTYKAVRKAARRPLIAESELLLYDDLREWGEVDATFALTGAAKAGHLQVLHPDKYRNGNGHNGANGKTNYSSNSGAGNAAGLRSELDTSLLDRIKRA